MLHSLAKALKVSLYLLLIIAGVTLCVVNRTVVDLTLFPLPYAVSLPLFLLAIIFLVFGIVSGWLIARFKMTQVTRKHKDTQKRLVALENELTAIRTEKLIRNTAIKA